MEWYHWNSPGQLRAGSCGVILVAGSQAERCSDKGRRATVSWCHYDRRGTDTEPQLRTVACFSPVTSR
jgi:hypothetical protein